MINLKKRSFIEHLKANWKILFNKWKTEFFSLLFNGLFNKNRENKLE